MAKKTYPKRSKEEIQAEVKSLTDLALEGIKEYARTPEQQLELLEFMSRFYEYSPRNQVLIQKQFPGAQGVGTYKFFKDLGFSVNKGEKSKIKILRPQEVSYFIDEAQKLRRIADASPAQLKKIESGILKKKTYRTFYPFSVFDITQTNAKPEDYPKLFPNRPFDLDVENPEMLNQVREGLQGIAADIGVPITSPEESQFKGFELGAAKGAFIESREGDKEIVLRTGFSEAESAATLIHELAHATLHDPFTQREGSYWTTETLNSNDPSLKELQAEMVSFVVSRHFGIDTSEQAIPYMAEWTKKLATLDQESEWDQAKILGEIQQTSRQFIEKIEGQFTQVFNRETTKETEKERERGDIFMTESEEIRSAVERLGKASDQLILFEAEQLIGNEALESLSFTQLSEKQATLDRYLAFEELAVQVDEVFFANLEKTYDLYTPEGLGAAKEMLSEKLYEEYQDKQEAIKQENAALGAYEDIQQGYTQEESALARFSQKYGIADDLAFSLADCERFYKMADQVDEKQLLAQIKLHRNETVFDWSYTGEKTPEEIAAYRNEQLLNFKKIVIEGHNFYQVDESMEIVLVPAKEGQAIDFMIFDRVGDSSSLTMGSRDEAMAKLIELDAIPTDNLPFVGKFLGEGRDQKLQQHLIHNQVMRDTYRSETGREMT